MQNEIIVPGVRRLYPSFGVAARTIILEEGIRGFWLPGLTPAILREMSYSSMRFGLYSPVKDTLATALSIPKGSEPFVLKLLAGVCTGAIGSSLANPTDLVKIRFQSEAGRIQNGVYVTGLYRGIQATAIRAALLTGGQMSSYDESKGQNPTSALSAVLLKQYGILKEGVPLHVASSLIAGLVATTVCAPADVVKTRLLSQSSTHGLEHKGAPPIYKGFMDCFSQILTKEGPSKLFRGWVPSYLRLESQPFYAVPVASYHGAGASRFGAFQDYLTVDFGGVHVNMNDNAVTANDGGEAKSHTSADIATTPGSDSNGSYDNDLLNGHSHRVRLLKIPLVQI
ncbi:hypothetical protein SmJEL517_g03318 [Synchytrium microbalum]|uniref:Mitochondrial carrier domain-containing protein n=1 Tax=Synchytrium microbalum TaxID=1806994 RepID=A0A507BYL4_9FUNG|nr:uncharacterized protein SmJEL517_g03318 [Synchytrium microbalum]TPX33897.1 hypothetical protein SmJEL517_g03318 [Synchytrium microbalum]